MGLQRATYFWHLNTQRTTPRSSQLQNLVLKQPVHKQRAHHKMWSTDGSAPNSLSLWSLSIIEKKVLSSELITWGVSWLVLYIFMYSMTKIVYFLIFFIFFSCRHPWWNAMVGHSKANFSIILSACKVVLLLATFLRTLVGSVSYKPGLISICFYESVTYKGKFLHWGIQCQDTTGKWARLHLAKWKY